MKEIGKEFSERLIRRWMGFDYCKFHFFGWSSRSTCRSIIQRNHRIPFTTMLENILNLISFLAMARVYHGSLDIVGRNFDLPESLGTRRICSGEEQSSRRRLKGWMGSCR